MKTDELEKNLGLVPAYNDYEINNIVTGFTSDLLSDVMGNADEDSVLITIQAHKNTIACCSLAGITAVIICSGRKVPQDMIDAAKDEGIAIFTTKDNQFTTSFKVHGIL
ncbi:iron-sulfur binding hydrogenase [Thiospirochaeta perfilievii]|uniref:Iron-sulfur binding hydrogenase n=1 Tax=Thiospirochaeta perfilievii TaxID=252967 RepID=A0A5C1Q806_9SPIO|nr:DRTGG domain-containing protein [Thiospirochaeta perfilievii]QEN04175.1 iron-sulfur binding hydrogenase [Thiospirochaeta perfilievii]